MKKIHKYNGAVLDDFQVLYAKRLAAIDTLLHDDGAMENMIDFGANYTHSPKEDSEVRKVLKNYVIKLLESAKG